MNFDNIPLELRQLVQWVVWKLEQPFGGKPTKVPYNPKNGFHASSTDRKTWGSFDEAKSAYVNGNGAYNGIGFVFSKDDPYCGIDLDAAQGDTEIQQRQQAIFEYVDSYAELSPSGEGLHIICKASVPHGRKRSLVEIYSEGRYFTMTGNVYRDAPINECTDKVRAIWDQMGVSAEPAYFQGDFIQRNDDAEVYRQASEAKNGDLFLRLWNGDWSGYPSNADGSGSSEADFALVDIIAYYSKNRMQIQRMFEASALGKRDKYVKASYARRATLIGYMINKSFDLMLPPVDLSAILDRVNAALASSPSVRQELGGPTTPAGGIEPPPAPPSPPSNRVYDGFDLGLWQRERIDGNRSILGAVADYIYAQSPRPVYELSLAAAIGFFAGVCGRSFNISGTGLNLYTMVLAHTGAGKEAMGSGISKLVEAVASTEGAAGQRHEAFRSILGPAEMASGQGLLKHLSEATPPCYVSVTGEIGLKLKQISGPSATNADIQLQRVLLDLFNKSGAGNSVQPTVYSDKTKNTEVIYSPSFSILGEGVPETFYQSFDDRAITSGLLPRFLIIEYNGEVPYLNENAAYVKPDPSLVKFIDNWFGSIMSRTNKGEVFAIPMTDDAARRSKEIDKYQTDKINNSPGEINRQLWNRFHVKVLKLAAIVAIGESPHNPKVSVDNIEWAASLICHDIVRLIEKFERGEIGGDNELNEQEDAVRKAIKRYLTTDAHILAHTYGVLPAMRFDMVIPYSYIQQMVRKLSCFKRDRRGAIDALRLVLRDMVDKGHIRELTDVKQKEKYNVTKKILYVPEDVNWFFAA